MESSSGSKRRLRSTASRVGDSEYIPIRSVQLPKDAFQPDVSKCSLPFAKIMSGGPAPPWYSPPADRAPVVFADGHVRSYDDPDRTINPKRDNTAEYIENWDPLQRRHAFP